MASIVDQVPFNIHTGNGVTTTFGYTFQIFDDGDLAISVDGIAITSGFSVAGVGDQAGGDVTFNTPPASGSKVLLLRDTALRRDIDYSVNSDLPSETINFDVNRVWTAIQDAFERIGRAPTVPVGESIGEFPSASDRASMYLAFDASGNPVASLGTVADSGLRSDLASTSAGKGAALVGALQSGTGAVTRTLQSKAADIVSGTDFATGDGVTDDLAKLNLAITRSPREVFLPTADFRVSADLTNPFGARFVGPGRILQTKSIGGVSFDFQTNSYADDGHYLIGKEYLYRAYQRLTAFAFTSSTSNLAVELYGDSTVAGTGEHTAPYQLVNMLPAMFRTRGIPNVTVTNRGVSGTKISEMDVISHLATPIDLIFIKYGINDAALVYTDGFNSALTTFETQLRSKLAAIRANANGGLAALSIVLVGPNSTYAQYGQNTPWYERVRNIYVQAARDYQCAYFDTYAYLRDSIHAVNLWMDNVGDGSTIHPRNMMMAWIWGKLIDELFGAAETRPFAMNSFQNLGNVASASITNALAPSTYAYGISMHRATSGNGFPEDGFVTTWKSVDTNVMQQLWTYNTAKPKVLVRVADIGSDAWGSWTGQATALTFSNRWSNFDVNWSQAQAVLDESGYVQVSGLIASGTTTAGTTMATLPAGMRPAKIMLFPVVYASGTLGVARVSPDGTIKAETAANSTYTSLDAIKFKAV